MHGRLTCVVELTADAETRRKRMAGRGDEQSYIDQLTPIKPLGYEEEIKPQFSIDTTGLTPTEVADQVMQRLQGTPWGC